MKPITATEAARSFSDILNRIRYGNESFVVTRGGSPVCRMVPVDDQPMATVNDLLDYLEDAGRPDERFAGDLEAIQASQPKLPPSPWDS
jgi:antitoxin (DNA-binding transcriptional repressor) of toxin-antitoxin stability system